MSDRDEFQFDVDELTEEELEIMEKIKSDASLIDVPDSISPLRMREKLKSVKPDRKVLKFNRGVMGMTSRIVAACFVGVVALGAGTIAFVENKNANQSGQEVVMSAQEIESESADSGESEATIDEPLGLDSIGDLTRATGYEELFEKFYGATVNRDDTLIYETEVMEEASDAAPAESSKDVGLSDMNMSNAAADGTGDAGGYYSDTILQHEGVDEGDSIKTDGRAVSVLKDTNASLYILDAKDLKEQATIDFSKNRLSNEDGAYTNVNEFFLKDGKLYVIYQVHSRRLNYLKDRLYSDVIDDKASADVANNQLEYIDSYKNATCVEIYDVADATKPRLEKTLSQKGGYITSRMVGDRFYLMTNESAYNYVVCCDTEYAVAKENLAQWVPTVNDCPVEPQDIYYKDDSRSYQCISSFDMSNYSTIDTKVIYDSWAQFYMTPNNLYIYETDWEDNCHYLPEGEFDDSYDNYYKCKTKLTRFDISSGKIIAAASDTFDGCISDTFAIRENGDYIYLIMDIDEQHYKDSWKPVVTKDWTDLYVVDKDLKLVGKLTEIAPGEQVYSARFIGDIGYFVTYRNMDPLFSVDLSNPREPKLLGELEIPGFSDYLHPWGDHNLLGIGEERDKDSNFIGLKISLYDVTDPTNVKEVDKTVLDADASSALYNYKEILADDNIGLAGFTATRYNYNDSDFDWESDDNWCNRFAYIFRIEGNKIITESEIMLDEGRDLYSWNNSRILYIDGMIYVTDEISIRQFDTKAGYRERCRYDFPQVDASYLPVWYGVCD